MPSFLPGSSKLFWPIERCKKRWAPWARLVLFFPPLLIFRLSSFTVSASEQFLHAQSLCCQQSLFLPLHNFSRWVWAQIVHLCTIFLNAFCKSVSGWKILIWKMELEVGDNLLHISEHGLIASKVYWRGSSLEDEGQPNSTPQIRSLRHSLAP